MKFHFITYFQIRSIRVTHTASLKADCSKKSDPISFPHLTFNLSKPQYPSKKMPLFSPPRADSLLALTHFNFAESNSLKNPSQS